MPELPEVETVRQSLEQSILGRWVSEVVVGAFGGVIGDLTPDQFRGLIVGREIIGIKRRGKYLLIDFDDGAGLIVHLRMTGSLTIAGSDTPPVRFEHLGILLSNGTSIRFADQRKFGRILYRPSSIPRPLEGKLGPEPLGARFSARYLTRTLRGRSAPIKALLLDQRVVAGIGNIYADEALFRSRIHPQRSGGGLSPRETASLVCSIKHVLRLAIERRGTTFSSYRDGNGEAGDNLPFLKVYGRGRRGEPCLRCGKPLAILTVGGRTSHYCPRCQTLDGSRLDILDAP
ncbi:MAG: bifunctional DNA-formamidopyrimidine glycosylase/DNA-(apurinic or apyrimidinic site) lyase [Gemmatimonadota bacterium]|nr:bifunctional DNA-formamidopyrimidine glycosylase/DNA-(apurinic or apyrimidinic site) lyase [Gemmatimonadota bacterium]